MAMIEVKKHELFQDFRGKDEQNHLRKCEEQEISPALAPQDPSEDNQEDLMCWGVRNRTTFDQFAQNENVPKILETANQLIAYDKFKTMNGDVKPEANVY